MFSCKLNLVSKKCFSQCNRHQVAFTSHTVIDVSADQMALDNYQKMCACMHGSKEKKASGLTQWLYIRLCPTRDLQCNMGNYCSHTGGHYEHSGHSAPAMHSSQIPEQISNPLCAFTITIIVLLQYNNYYCVRGRKKIFLSAGVITHLKHHLEVFLLQILLWV